MPQVFMVVRCYACNVFQVQQVKKVPKWVCKMCGEKQSLKKEYGSGSGADCRKHVQKLNLLKASVENVTMPEVVNEQDVELQGYNDDDNFIDGYEQQAESLRQNTPTASVWNQYINDQDDNLSHEIELQTSSDFDASKITTDRDIFKTRGRGRRGWKRGSSDGSGGRKRKFNEDDYHEEDFSQESHPASFAGGLHGYTTREPWMKNLGNVKGHPQQQQQTKPLGNYGYKTVKNAPGCDQESSDSKGRWGSFLNKTNKNQKYGVVKENTSKLLSKQASSSATSSKWGHFLEDAGECTEESSQESWQDDVQRSLLSQEWEDGSRHQGYLSNNEKQVMSGDCGFRPGDGNIERSRASFPADIATGSERPIPDDNNMITSSITKASLRPTSNRESGYSIGEHTGESLQVSSRWNVYMSSQSEIHNLKDTSKEVRNKVEINFSNKNRSESSHNVGKYEPILQISSVNSKPNFQNETSGRSKMESKVDDNLFSIDEERHLDEIFSDDW